MDSEFGQITAIMWFCWF